MPWIATEAFPIAAVVFTAVYVSLIVGGIVGRDTYLSENSLLADYVLTCSLSYVVNVGKVGLR